MEEAEVTRRLIRFLKEQKGLTLLELTVVAAILSLLAALTAVAVTGTVSQSRATTKTTDTAEIQKAVDNYAGQHPQGRYPTPDGCLPGTGLDTASFTCSATVTEHSQVFTASESTLGVDLDGDGQLTSSVKLVPIIWDNGFIDANGNTVTFYPDFVGKLPNHAYDRCAPGQACESWVKYGTADYDSDGVTDYVAGDTVDAITSLELASLPVVWALDGNGKVRVVLPDERY
jgi:prepilin-type N-terminal cleavage/methylation domain-containing protein